MTVNIKVCKFGGSSVANSVQIKRVADIISSDNKRKIVVVSAPKHVTDILIQCAEKYFSSKKFPKAEFERVKEIYDEIGQNLKVKKVTDSELDELKGRIETEAKNRKGYEDLVKSWGEHSNAKVIAAYFNTVGIDTEFVSPKDCKFFVSEDFGNARVLDISYKNISEYIKKIKKTILFPGFYGVTKSGKVATFSRGGSDLTGSIVAAAVSAEIYENWTDQDGIRASDPRIVKEPIRIKTITYKEIRELAYMGFKVFHAEAMIPAMRNNIPINIKNTNNPENNGTLIVNQRKETGYPVIGIASRKDFAVFNVEKILMDKEVGFGRKLLEIFEDSGLSYEHTPSGIDSISVILDQSQLNDKLTQSIIRKIKETLAPQSVMVEFDKCLISVVGIGLKRTPGISSRITGSLAKAGVNIEILNQGASEISQIIGIENKDAIKAVNAIYDEFYRRVDI